MDFTEISQGRKKNKRDISALWRGNILISPIGTFNFFFFFHFIFFLGCQLQFFSPQMMRLKFSVEFSFMDVLRFVNFPHLGKSKNLSILWKIILSLFSTSNCTLLISVFHKISLVLILGFYRWGKCFLILVWSSPRVHQPVARNREKITLLFLFILPNFYACCLQVCF